MFGNGNVRGVLLEEAILHLLRKSGYRPVDPQGAEHDDDTTLGSRSAGTVVKGRGAEHQIDAVADYLIHPPFTHPQRLLVEAKCYAPRYPVDLPVLRNAVGVLKDVSEYWVPYNPERKRGPREQEQEQRRRDHPRHHYQYAVFTTSEFTVPAQRYAYAHDIHLLPLRRSAYLRPIVAAIAETDRALANAGLIAPATRHRGRVAGARGLRLFELRALVRRLLTHAPYPANAPGLYERTLWPFVQACASLDGAVMGMAAGTFPLFLIPEPGTRVADLGPSLSVAIRWNEREWYIEDRANRRKVFSFDLPTEIFRLFAEEGALSARRALDLKQHVLHEIQGVHTDGYGELRLLRLQLDQDWLARARARLDGLEQTAP
jgi:hypothetical protein